MVDKSNSEMLRGFCDRQMDRQMDGQMDRQTDGQTDICNSRVAFPTSRIAILLELIKKYSHSTQGPRW